MNHDTIKMIHHRFVENNTGAKPKRHHHTNDPPYPLAVDSQRKACSLAKKHCQLILPTLHLDCVFTASI